MFAKLFARSTKLVPFNMANQIQQTGLRIDRENATIRRAGMATSQEITFPKESLPIAGMTVTMENTNSRFTVTRFATLGLFAFALKKHWNYFVFTTADGMEYMARVRGMNAGQAQVWMRQFNNLSRQLQQNQNAAA